MEQVVSQSEAPRRFDTIIISSFALAGCSWPCSAYLQRHCLFRRFTRAGDGHPHGPRLRSISHIMRLILISGLKLAAIVAFSASQEPLSHRASYDRSSFIDPLRRGDMSPDSRIAVLVPGSRSLAIPARRAASVGSIQALRGNRPRDVPHGSQAPYSSSLTCSIQSIRPCPSSFCPGWRYASSPSSARPRASASRQAKTRPHRPAGFPRSAHPSAAPGRSRPSRSASDRADACATRCARRARR